MRHRFRVTCPTCSATKSAKWTRRAEVPDPMLEIYTHRRGIRDDGTPIRCEGSGTLVEPVAVPR